MIGQYLFTAFYYTLIICNIFLIVVIITRNSSHSLKSYNSKEIVDVDNGLVKRQQIDSSQSFYNSGEMTIYTEATQLVRTAVDFCSQNGDQYGFTIKTARNCVDHIVHAIHSLKVAGEDINDWNFEFKNQKMRNGYEKLVLEAVYTKKDLRHDAHTNDNYSRLHEIPDGISEFFQIDLKINEIDYIFEFSKPSNSLLNDALENISVQINHLAHDFCQLKGYELGAISVDSVPKGFMDRFFTIDPLMKNCELPLREALYINVQNKLMKT